MRAYVLLSGGIDSTTCLYLAYQQFTDVVGVSVDYGQRHHKEVEYAERSCSKLGVKHHVLNLRGIVPKTMLTDPDAAVPDISYDEIKGVSPTYVPYRNGLLLSAAASFIAGEQDKWEKEPKSTFDAYRTQYDPSPKVVSEWALYFGAHAEDAQNWAYPDCTPEFIGAMANAIYIGTYQKLRLHTPLEWLSKEEIISVGSKLGVPWRNTWSCYKGGDMHCGVCPTCRARRTGFKKAGFVDPTVYEFAM